MSSIGDGSAVAIRRLQDRIRELEAEVKALRKDQNDRQAIDDAAKVVDFVEAATASHGILKV